ncbi:MAG: mechanosensitive ion channel [Hydrococcus sp. Prado102]|jgi:small-conductance mechanosensitive channel|nr:mechanosensitive ion channel [Hydrococcus sp. Prado102]
MEFNRFLGEIFQLFTAPLFQMGEEQISLIWVLRLIISFIVLAFLTTLVKRFLKYRLLGKLGIDPGNREALSTLISYSFGALGCVIVIQLSGFDLATFAVIAGGLGVGIGFGLQDVTKNLVSGITLLIERKLRVGDFIQLDTISGYIDEISIRSAVIHTLDGNEVIIPNSLLVESRIINKSYTNLKGLIRMPVGVAYGSDPILVTEVLLNSAYMDNNILYQPPPKVVFIGFGDNALNFELFVWVNTIDKELLIKSSLNFIIEYNLRAADIQIPFPQRDLWLKNPEILNLPSKKDSQKEDIKQINKSLSQSFFLRDLLRQISYFSALSDIHLRSLIELGCRKHLEESEILCRQGDPGNAFYIVLSGTIEAIYEQEKIEKQLFTFEAGQFFGELPLMLGVPYPTTMRSQSDTILFAIDSKSFGQLLKSYPGLSEEIVQELAKRQEVLQEFEKQMKELNLIPDSEEGKSPVVWLRKQIKKLFGI